MSEILKFWPFSDKEPRESQLFGFDWLVNQDKKYLFLESPVGSGKSALAMAYSGFLNQGRGSSYILTPQRILQQQYETSFRRELLFSLYGKSNYECVSKNTDCSIGCNTPPACEFCSHKAALSSAIASPNLVMNYKLALLHFAYLPLLDKRQLMVLDECHSLEKELIAFDSLEISAYHCSKYGIKFKPFKQISDAYTWVIDEYQDKVEDIFHDMQDKIATLKNKNFLNPDEITMMKDFEKLERYIKTIFSFTAYSLKEVQEKYVLVNDGKSFFEFKKLFAKDQFNKIVKPKADKFLFMSATILDQKGYCRDLGIDPKEAAFVSLKSEFEPKNRPVYFMPSLKMNSKWKDDNNEKSREALINKVFGLLDLHKEHSGIIHTGNFEVAKWLISKLENNIDHRIFHHIPSDNDEEKTDRNNTINNFMECRKPALLISPSITEGLDLKHDLSRFAIFVKIPFGYLGDQWIKARMDLSTEWYQRMALIDVMQGCGRVVRSTDDWGNVYILDGSWAYLLSQTSGRIPEWWFDSYCEYED